MPLCSGDLPAMVERFLNIYTEYIDVYDGSWKLYLLHSYMNCGSVVVVP